MLCLEHTVKLLKGKHEINIASYRVTACLKLLGCTRTDKANLAVRVLLLDKTACKNHGSKCHGDGFCLLGEELLSHNRPSRAAGCSHEGQLVRNLVHEVMCLHNCAEICTDGNLYGILKAQSLEGGFELVRRKIRSELSGDSRSNGSIYRYIFILNSLYQLEYLSLIRYGTEGAVGKAHAAGDALVLIDIGSAEFVGAYCFHAAGICTGTCHSVNSTVRAGLYAFSALNTGILINNRMSVLDGYCFLGAYNRAGMRKTALTLVCNLHHIVRT